MGIICSTTVLVLATSEDGHIYSLDTVGAVDKDYSYFTTGTSIEYATYVASPTISDIDEDSKVEIVLGPSSVNIKQADDYKCYPGAIKWGMLGAGTKHDGNGDNRFAIIIQGGSGDFDFEEDQYTYNVQEMARILTEHPRNIKPGPGYTGYYLQDHMYFAQAHDLDSVYRIIPELEKDVKIPKVSRHDGTGKNRIKNMIKEVALKADSYDNVLFFYTSHGRPHDYIPFNNRIYLFDANNHHQTAEQKPWETANDAKWSKTGDIRVSELDNYLDKIECMKMIIILQSCFSGNWIADDLSSNELLVNDANEKNRVVITSEVKSQNDPAKVTKLSIFDKCNMQPSEFVNPSPPPDQIKVQVYYIGTGSDDDPPTGDGEEYQSTPGGQWRYQVNKYEDSPHEDLYEIDTSSGTFLLDFYENWKDEGAEFVSGLTEAYFTDLFNEDNVESNDVLDGDEYTINGFNGYSHFPSITGNDNDYVSCKEAYNFMKLFHLGYRLNQNPWIDNPQYEPTNLEEGNNYLF